MNYSELFDQLLNYVEGGVLSLQSANVVLESANSKFNIDNFIITDDTDIVNLINESLSDVVILGKYIMPNSNLVDFILPEERMYIEGNLGNISFRGKGKLKRVTVSCRTREGITIPHIHVDGDKFHAAICLNEAKYFTHDPYIDMFTNKDQCRIFDEFMRSTYKGNTTMWDEACRLYSQRGAKIVGTQPDYNDLINKETVHETK